MDIPTSSIWNIILFNEAFKYGNGAKLWYYVQTIAAPLCVYTNEIILCNVILL
jgi:hypothetical protein